MVVKNKMSMVGINKFDGNQKDGTEIWLTAEGASSDEGIPQAGMSFTKGN
jgi:hypothetical protein